MIGTWAQRIAMGWLIYRLTGSVWMLGLLGFSGGIFMLLLAPFGGVLSDLFDRRRLMFVTQCLMLIQAIALLIIVWFGVVRPWHLIFLATVLGIISAIDTPIRYSLIPRLVTDRANIPNAIALNSLLMNGARVIGPAVGSLLLTTSGETACFALNAATFVFMLYSLSRMHWIEAPASAVGSQMRFFADGIKHVRDNPLVWKPLLFIAVVSFTVSQYPTLMPAVAEIIYKGGPAELGVFLSCAGTGSVFSALLLAKWGHTADLPKIASVGGLFAGAAMVLIAFVNIPLLGAILMVFIGGGMIAAIASTNTWLQNSISEAYRGRIMGLFSMAAMGIQPLGSIVSGAIGNFVDIRCVLFLNGMLCLSGAAIYVRRRPPVIKHVEHGD